MSQSFTVALTGRLASGKSTAGQLFTALGATVIDTDTLTHELLRPTSPLAASLRALVPQHCVTADHQFDRNALRQTLLDCPKLFAKWQACIHPVISQHVLTQCQQPTDSYYLIIIPILNTPYTTFTFQRCCLIDCKKITCQHRLQQRDSYHPDQLRLLNHHSQYIPKTADDIIDNNSDYNSLKKQVTLMHEQYTLLASSFC